MESGANREATALSLIGLRPLLARPGHTVLPALMRIGLALDVLATFARAMRPRHDSEALHLILLALFWLAVPAMLAGWWARTSTAITGVLLLVGYYGLGVFGGHRAAWDHHHTYILIAGVVLLALTECGRSLSVDRWLALRSGTARPQRADNWGLSLIGIQVCCVYFFSALDKCRWPFLSGAELERSLLQHHGTSDAITAPGWTTLLMLAALATVALELALPVGLWFRRSQRWLLPMAVVFHVALYIALPVSTFTITMLLLLMAFLPEDSVADALTRLAAPGSTAAPPPTRSADTAGCRRPG